MAIPEDEIAKRIKIATLKQMLENLETEEEAVIETARLRTVLTEEEIKDIENNIEQSTFEFMASGAAKQLWSDIKALISKSNLANNRKLLIQCSREGQAIAERLERLPCGDQDLFIRTDGVDDPCPFSNIEDYPPPIAFDEYDKYCGEWTGRGPLSKKSKRNSAQYSVIKSVIERLTAPPISAEERQRRDDIFQRLKNSTAGKRDD